MKNFKVSVRKLTDTNLLQEACAATSNHESHASLASLYKAEHSPVRTQLFWIEITNCKLFIVSHLVRHNVGVQCFQLSNREDRNKTRLPFPDFIDGIIANATEHPDWDDVRERDIQRLENAKEDYDRATPTNLAMLANAQSLLNMAKLRLCRQAHPETVKVFKAIREQIKQVDPDLAALMVPTCVYRCGLCGEPRCCGYNSTEAFKAELQDYVSHFTEKQRGINRTNETL